MPLRRTRSISRLFVSLTTLLACVIAAPAAAQSLKLPQYVHTAWRSGSGSTPGTILQFAQTPDGYLWCSTQHGVYRFDGVRFTKWQPPNGEKLPSESITSLAVTTDGTVWIGTLKGLISWHDSSGKLTRYEDGHIISPRVVEAADGTKWFGVQNKGLCAIRGRAVSCEAVGARPISLIRVGGTVWVTTEKAIWRWSPGPRREYALPAGTPVAIFPDNGALLMMSSREGRLWRMVDETISEYPISGLGPRLTRSQERPTEIELRRALRTRDGALWLTTDRGILHLQDGTTTRFTAADGLSGDVGWGSFEDREGNVWVSTEEGIDRFRPVAVRTISSTQGLSSPTVWAVQADPAGGVWISTAAGLDRVMAGTTHLVHTKLRGPVHGLALHADGQLLASTPAGLVAERRGRFPRIEGTPERLLTAATDARRQIWVSTARGELFTQPSGGTFEPLRIPLPGLGAPAQRNLRTILSDGQGGIWVELELGSITHVSANLVTTTYLHPKGEQLGLGTTTDIRLGSDGWIWAATSEGGVARMKNGRIMLLSNKNGLPCPYARWTIEDDDHALWIGVSCGLVRIARPEWEAWTTDPERVVKVTLFGRDDGVNPVGLRRGLSPLVTKSTDGRIWFLVADGVGVFDPRQLSVSPEAMQPRIEQISANGRAERITTTSVRIHLAPSLRNLEIEYTAPAFTASEKLRFRFKLEGQDPDWREVVNERRVTYSNLAPGPYRFHVMAANAAGVWSSNIAVLDFDVAPAFYQTRSFIAAMTALGLLLIGIAHRLRVRQVSRALSRRFDERLAERTRVARELHDTFLQTVNGTRVVADHALTNRADHVGVVRAMEQVSEWLRQATDEARTALNSLRASTTETNDLAEAFRRVADECRVNSRAEISVSVRGDAREMHPVIRDEVYRIGYEAIRNASLHSTGDRVMISLEYGHDLTLRVADNGTGIDPAFIEKGKEGHFGLRGMKERAERIDGRLTIVSSAQTGTTIILVLPGRVAFRSLATR